ncbi:hypothetical protein ACFQ1I_32935 [Kitasatospora arboriphila]
MKHTAPPQEQDAGLGPDSVQVEPRVIAVGDLLAATLIVTGYPAEVGPGWLEPLLTYPGRLDVSLHVEPVPAATASARLRRQRARLEASRRIGHRRGGLDDPETEAAAADAAELAWRVARGEGKLFRAGLYLTVYAPDREQLAGELSAVRALAESMLLRCQPATWRMLQGWTTCLPLGTDRLQAVRTFDTEALAACFPFASPDLPRSAAGSGSGVGEVLYGLNAAASGMVLWDRFAQDNHNSVTLARSGAGKSYLTKLEVLRLLYQGVQVRVVDPEDEYARLADAAAARSSAPVRPVCASIRSTSRPTARRTRSPAVCCSCTPSSPSSSARRSRPPRRPCWMRLSSALTAPSASPATPPPTTCPHRCSPASPPHSPAWRTRLPGGSPPSSPPTPRAATGSCSTAPPPTGRTGIWPSTRCARSPTS